MGYPTEFRYTKDHEWARIEGDKATIGISDFAQSELGEVVFVELPTIGQRVKKGETLCVVESTKAASDVYAPLSGVVTEVNSALEQEPTTLNSSPHADGWLVKLAEIDLTEAEHLMNASAYEAHLT